MIAPLIIAGAIAVGGAVLGAMSGARASKKARAASYRIFREGLDFQERMADQAVAKLDPYEQFGRSAMGTLQGFLDDPSSVRDSPAYDFMFKEGARGVRQMGGAMGNLMSGQGML